MTRRTTPQADFQAYFNVADELTDPHMRLDDLDATHRANARRAAVEHDLPWPPELADAEDFALAHPEWLRGEPGW